MITSRLLSRDTVSTKFLEVTAVLLGRSATFKTITCGKVKQFAANSTGLNPAWGNAVIESVCGIMWEEGASSTEFQSKIALLWGYIKAMHALAPNDGAYFNEASLFEIDWQQAFFGARYATLKTIKSKFDPNSMFVVAEAVGSEDWIANLMCHN